MSQKLCACHCAVCTRGFVCHEQQKTKLLFPTMHQDFDSMIGRVVDIVGIGIGDRGRSCEEHRVCGRVLAPDVIVRLRKEEIMVEGRIEVAICVYWVTDSVDRCRVGFLPRYMAVYADCLNGVLAQVSDVFDESHPSPSIRKKVHHNHGYCEATILDPRDII